MNLGYKHNNDHNDWDEDKLALGFKLGRLERTTSDRQFNWEMMYVQTISKTSTNKVFQMNPI